MYNSISILGFLLASYFLLRILKPSETCESILMLFCIFTGQILIAGYVLSSIKHINDLKYWSLLSLASFFISFVIVLTKKEFRQLVFISIKAIPKFSFTTINTDYIKSTSKFEKVLLSSLLLTTIVTGLINLILIIFTAPNHWDSMTYHLARVAYYLQYNSLNYYSANYWAQVIQPKNSSILLIYTYLVSGKNENLTQLVQYVSYWIAVISIYGISRKIGGNKIQGMFAALVFAILTEVLLEATTTQNDMMITAYIGTVVFFLFSFKEKRQYKYLFLSSLGIGISLGIKSTTLLVFPSIALIALYNLFQREVELKISIHNVLIYTIFILLAIIIFALPSGYVENYKKFNNPIGPEFVRQGHSYENKSAKYILLNGTKNIVRYGFDFLSFDGLPRNDIINKAQKYLRCIPKIIIKKFWNKFRNR